MKRRTTPPTPAKKRAKVVNPNHFESAPTFQNPREAITAIKMGETDVALVDTGIKIAPEHMCRYYNARANPQHRVTEVSTWGDLLSNPRCLPGVTNGMWHTYATKMHDAVYESPIVDELFTALTDTPEWRIRPNRVRVNIHNDDMGWKSAHLEGEYVMSEDTDIGTIFCVTPGRTFTYYAGSRNCPHARELYARKGGLHTFFVQPTQQELSRYKRTTIATTRPGQFILFAGSAVHEISRHTPSVSLFLSPYNPAREPVAPYGGLTRAKAKLLQKLCPHAPPLPPCLSSPGQKRQHPVQFDTMNRRETEIFGSLFGIGGHVWPSGKRTFFLHHTMASNHWHPRLLPFNFDKEGKFNYEVLTPSLVQDCPDFDHTYWHTLPLIHAHVQDIAYMRAKYTGIPACAWDLVRYWTKDPRTCSDELAWRRGYIM